MDEDGLLAYIDTHQLRGPAANYLLERDRDGPSRAVGDYARSNVCSEYQSRKMGCSIATESRSGELAYAIHLDHDRSVAAYYYQPPPVEVRTTDKRGHKRRSLYTPDFLVLSDRGPSVIEIKSRAKLDSLIAKRSADWSHADGRFQFHPAIEAFRDRNLTHQTVSTDELGKVYIANLDLILRATTNLPRTDPEVADRALRIVHKERCIRLSCLAEQLRQAAMTDFIVMVADQQLFTNLETSLLSRPDSCWITACREDLKIGEELDRLAHGVAPADREASTNHVPSSEAVARALDRYDRLMSGEKSRSTRRFKAQVSEGQKRGLSPLQSLIDNLEQSGNRDGKLAKPVQEYLKAYIQQLTDDGRRLTSEAAYREYRWAAQKQHLEYSAVSKTTFLSHLRRRDPIQVALQRGGKRLRNAAQAPSPVDDRAVKAVRPLELATCDHYLVDLFCTFAETRDKRYARKPWLTVLRDIATGMVLAIWVSFESPSRISCAMVMRICLATHGRLPEAVVVDRGAEFKSVYFRAAMAHFQVHIHLRPAAHPRFGSEAERFFQQLREQWLVHLVGNSVAKQEARSISRSHSPKANAELSLEEFIESAIEFADWQASETVNEQSLSPIVAYRQGLERFPFSGIPWPYDDEFLIATAVDVRHFKLDPKRGIHIGHNNHYWHPKLASSSLRCNQLEVRIEPEDPYRVYVRVRDRWLTCRASGSPKFDLLTPIARQAEAIRQLSRDRIHGPLQTDAALNQMERIHQSSGIHEPEEPQAAPPVPTSASDLFDPFDWAREQSLDKPNVTEWKHHG